MTAIWRHDGTGWRVLSPMGFPDEAALHDLVEEAPQILPLRASRLTVLGREVLLGGNYADLIAVVPSGRLATLFTELLGLNCPMRTSTWHKLKTAEEDYRNPEIQDYQNHNDAYP